MGDEPVAALEADERHWRLTDKVNTVELRSRVLSMIRKGATAEQVAKTISEGDPENGVPPVQMTSDAVSKMVRKYLDRVHTEDALTVEQLRTLENERLDELWLSLQRQLRNPDGSLNLKIVDRLTRLSERRAKMNGLDAAQRHELFIGNGLAALGIEEEHLERSQKAFVDAFGEEIPDVEIKAEPKQIEAG